MTLTRWQRPVGHGLAAGCQSCAPEDGLSQLLQSFGSIFDSPLGASLETQFTGEWLPAVDVHDGKDTVTVKAELPGMKKEDIDISLQEGVLTLSGERKDSREAASGGASHCERRFGRFQRGISLPYKVDTQSIKAAYTDGVLTIELAKAEEAKPKQIKIQFN
jgi:HSP20 family protein